MADYVVVLPWWAENLIKAQAALLEAYELYNEMYIEEHHDELWKDVKTYRIIHHEMTTGKGPGNSTSFKF